MSDAVVHPLCNCQIFPGMLKGHGDHRISSDCPRSKQCNNFREFTNRQFVSSDHSQKFRDKHTK